AGVARVDRSIRLNGLIDKSAFRIANGTQRANDAACHGAAKTEGIADRVNLLPYHEILGIAERGRRQARRLDLDHREIVQTIASYDLGGILFLVVESHFNLPRSFHHMEVRQDVPFLINDESRSLALLWYRSPKEVHTDRGRRDIHDRRYALLVDVDVDLLLG